MLTVFDARQARHQPLLELQDGAFTQFAESPTRANAILSRLPDPIAPDDFGIDPILAVHAADYVGFLKSIYADWRGEGRAGDAIPYVFPVGAQSKRDHLRIDARIGSFAYDVGTPIAEHTFESAYWSAQTALTALDTISSGAAARSFALCRPPGHHAGRAYCGGYCYFNSAAIAAEKARESGARRVAILDVDYHHGNGTQDIFYARDDVFVVSIHADPRVDYPFF
ncbi:MAG: histone deacetylase family protein, partial [Pseudomonadota bacterium]